MAVPRGVRDHRGPFYIIIFFGGAVILVRAMACGVDSNGLPGLPHIMASGASASDFRACGVDSNGLPGLPHTCSRGVDSNGLPGLPRTWLLAPVQAISELVVLTVTACLNYLAPALAVLTVTACLDYLAPLPLISLASGLFASPGLAWVVLAQ